MARARLDFFHDLFQSFLPPNEACLAFCSGARVQGLGFRGVGFWGLAFYGGGSVGLSKYT